MRALVVPATMRLLGRLNWWAPRPLATLYRRLGLAETAEASKSDRPAAIDSTSLAGLLSTKQAPPTDEEVARWLDERQAERYR